MANRFLFPAILCLAASLASASCGGDGTTPGADVAPADVDVPAADAPRTDVPAADVPAADVPAVDAPAVDAPATDAPAMDIPATDAPPADLPAGDIGPDDGTGPAPATVEAINRDEVGDKIPVVLQGVVAMSRKFLVSQSKATGSCLWGAFVSSPGLVETAPYTGLLVLSYGNDATIPEGGTKAYCPVPPQEPAGDALPDDLKPGDVLDLSGKAQRYLPTSCPEGTSTVAQHQLAQVTMATRTGTAAVPAPHVLTGAEAASLVAQQDAAAHDSWGGVKVRLDGLASVPQSGAFGDAYGNFFLDVGGGATLQVGDGIYYQGLLGKTDACRAGPVAPAGQVFTSVAGFHTMDYCTWALEVGDKCADLAPASTDCTAASCFP